MLSSPSGGGKTTIARALLNSRPDMAYSVSSTTRPRRPQERQGVDYHFLTTEEFQAKVDAGEFLEWAAYSGHRYGTLRSEIEGILSSGKHAVLDIDVVGARTIRRRLANVVTIFILPPSAAVLRQRLARRSTERAEAVETRLRRAVEELEAAVEYDYVVVNDKRDQAVAEVQSIIDAECRKTTRQGDLADVLHTLRDELTANESP